MGERLEDWDRTCGTLAAEAGVIVASIGYRLAPEHPFPAAVEDTWAGLHWVAGNAAEWGGDPARLAVMGGSAGGNLAAVVAQRARDEGGPTLALQVLTVPTLNAGGEPTESMRLFGSGFGLNGMEQMRDAYFQDADDRLHPWASPLLVEDLSGLPPAVIHTAQFDPLRDEGERYAERLRQAGVAVELRRFDGRSTASWDPPVRAKRAADSSPARYAARSEAHASDDESIRASTKPGGRWVVMGQRVLSPL